jgi:predicted dehydrogenase
MLKAIQVGVGGFGLSWFELLQSYQQAEVAAIVDPLETNVQAALKRANRNVLSFDSLAKAIEKVEADFVLIVTPPTTHADLAKTAIKAKLHVMMEKPLTDTLEEGKALLAFTNSHAQKVMVSQNYRYHPQIQTIKALLDQQVIGKVEYGDYYFNRATRFGGWRDEYADILLQDMAIHHFDILRFLLEKEAVEVTAASFRPSWSWFKGMPNAHVDILFEDEVRISYTGRWAGKGRKTPWNGELRLVGEKGAIELVDDRVYMYKGEADEPTEIQLQTSLLPDRLLSLDAFVAAIRHDTVPPTSIEDNVKSLELTWAAIEAAKSGKKWTC